MRLHHLALTLACVACATGQVAHAASFDCAKAVSAREHLICRRPRLSKMDQELGSLYSARLASLSRAGTASLRNAKRAWFRSTNEVCGLLPHAPPVANGGNTPLFCLSRAYERRLIDIGQTGRFGSYVFTRVDTYDVQPDTNAVGSENGPSFDVHHVGYPQIDAATDPVLVAWNEKAAADGTAFANVGLQGGEYDETDGDYQLGQMTKGMISLLWTVSFNTHGAMHGGYGAKAWNAMLGSPLRDVTPSDLFGKEAEWKGRLEEIALAAIKDHGWKGGGNEDDFLRLAIDDPRKWFLRPEGLDVSFSAYDGGCYMCTPNDGLVPWSRLAPLLKTTLVP